MLAACGREDRGVSWTVGGGNMNHQVYSIHTYKKTLDHIFFEMRDRPRLAYFPVGESGPQHEIVPSQWEPTPCLTT